MAMQKLEFKEIIEAGTVWQLIVNYNGEEFGRIILKDIKQRKSVYHYIAVSIENIFRQIPDMEMEALRQNTDIMQFFEIASGAMEDSEMETLLKWFEVWVEIA